MKIPLSLIRSYIHLDEPLSVICETLTLLGIEVDAIENETPRFARVIAAEVRKAHPHASSDHLTIATVYDGAKEFTVICGAKNCRAGIKAAFAKAGACLYDEKRNEKRIEEVDIRGVHSQGMLCSAAELGLASDSEGILELPSDIPNGQDLTQILWDPVLELSLTPNLGHCMSALGIARELSAALKKPLRYPKIQVHENPASGVDRFEVSVQNPELCPRYLCRLIEQVQVGPSPFWLQQVLWASGFRPINNIVDISNYILIKTGQPLHAFDADKIEGRILSIQTLDTPHVFLGLDNISRDVPAGALFICDAKKPLAIAGILGGVHSAVSESTRTIVLEAALFNALSIRKTARQLGLRTESALRFEKGIDWQNIPEALDEACHLIAQLTHGQAAQGTIDIKKHKFALLEISLRAARVNRILGTQLSISEIEETLQRLGCKTHTKENTIHVVVPAYRNDLTQEIDLIEEVARIYGYNNIEKKTPLCTPSHTPDDPFYPFECQVRQRMIAQELQEIITCNLISPKLAGLLPDMPMLKVLHSKSEDYSILRSSLLPNHLEVVLTNLDQKNPALKAFEIGRIHLKQGDAVVEIPMLGVVFYGKNRPHHWDRKPADLDFYDLKGSIETLCAAIGAAVSFQQSSHQSFHPGRQADLHSNGLVIGSLGEVHPQLSAHLDIKQRVFFAEINLSHLLRLRTAHVQCHPLASFPGTERDWTLPLPQDLPCVSLFDMIRSFHSPLLEKAELIDLYIKPDDPAKRNATIRFTYRDRLKTISFEEADAAHAKLMESVSQKLLIS